MRDFDHLENWNFKLKFKNNLNLKKIQVYKSHLKEKLRKWKSTLSKAKRFILKTLLFYSLDPPFIQRIEFRKCSGFFQIQKTDFFFCKISTFVTIPLINIDVLMNKNYFVVYSIAVLIRPIGYFGLWPLVGIHLTF